MFKIKMRRIFPLVLAGLCAFSVISYSQCYQIHVA